MFDKKFIYIGLFALLFGVSSIALVKSPASSNSDAVGNELTLEGTVSDSETDSLLAGVEVELSELELTAETDENGYFIFENLEADTVYTLTVDHEGYEDYEEIIEFLEQSPTVEVDVELVPIEIEEDE